MIIDISHHQNPKDINYDKLCSQLDMAIIRVQYGSRTIDKYYKTHIAEMKKHNIPYGVYAWVRGVSENDMKVEAIDFYNRSKDYEPLFYILDVEKQSMDNMKVGINAYIDKLRTLTDKKIGIYIAHHLYKDFNLDLDEADFIWIPHYGKNDGTVNSKPDFYCDIHQYTSEGKLDGYGDNLDLNRLVGNKSLEYFIGQKETKCITKEEFDEYKNNVEKELTELKLKLEQFKSEYVLKAEFEEFKNNLVKAIKGDE